MDQNFIENSLVILSKGTIDLFLEQPNPGDLIALYTFYYYTAKWQKTNRPKSTTAYTATGLKKGVDWVRKNKKALIELGLIENHLEKDERGKIVGWYIKLNYIFRAETVGSIPPPKELHSKKIQIEKKSKPAEQKESDKYIVPKITRHWNEQPDLTTHSTQTIWRNFQKKHKAIITDYGEETIKEAITLYQQVLSSTEHFFSYRWPLWEFLSLGVDRFIPDADPLRNFLTDKSPPEKPFAERMKKAEAINAHR